MRYRVVVEPSDRVCTIPYQKWTQLPESPVAFLTEVARCGTPTAEVEGWNEGVMGGVSMSCGEYDLNLKLHRGQHQCPKEGEHLEVGGISDGGG